MLKAGDELLIVTTSENQERLTEVFGNKPA
jgi:Trk K+ transport system NAD-binding subunit